MLLDDEKVMLARAERLHAVNTLNDDLSRDECVAVWGAVKEQYSADLPKVLARLDEIRKLQHEEADKLAELKEAASILRDRILNDPEHDNDTINWALGLYDDELFDIVEA